jgi:peptide/nickel transport system substrate-binding protein
MNRIRIAQPAAAFLPLQQTTDSPPIQTIKALVFEPMMVWKNGYYSPGLIQNWSITNNGCHWHLKLRKGATFHDGKPCTTEDLIHTLNLIRNARDSFGMNGPYARYLKDLEFEALSDEILWVRSPDPTGDLGDIFCEIYVGRENDLGQPILGTGPYRVRDFQNGVSIRLEAVPGDIRARMDEIEVYQVAEAENRLKALQDGKVDIATSLENLKNIKRDDHYLWKQKAESLSVIYYLNGFTTPFNQLNARLAMNYAVDVDAIIVDIMQGYAIPASTVVSPFHYGFPNAIQPYPYNPAKAKALFSECEMPESLEIRTPTYMPEMGVQISERIVRYLQDIGISASVVVREDRPLYAKEIGYNKEIGSMALFDSSPHSTFRVLRDKISSQEQAVWWMGVQDDITASMITKATRCYKTQERFAAYSECLQRLHDCPPWLYLFHPIRLVAGNESLTGMDLNHTGIIEFNH